MATPKKQKHNSACGIQEKIAAVESLIAIDGQTLHIEGNHETIEKISSLIDENFKIIAPKMKIKFSDIPVLYRTRALMILQRSLAAARGSDRVLLNAVGPVIDADAYEETIKLWCYNPEPLGLEYNDFLPIRF